MAQAELNVGDYLRIFRKRKFTVFLTFFLTTLVTFFYSGSKIPVYVSEAKVKIEERRPAVIGYIIQRVNVGDFIATQQEIMKGRLMAERVARSLGFVNASMTPGEVEAAVRKIQSAVVTSRVETTNVIRITASADTPKLAQDIAEAMANACIKLNLEEKNREVSSVRLFIEKELGKAVKNLEKSQAELADFQEKGGTPKEQTALILEEISKLELEHKNLLLKATPRHPEVLSLEERIENLRGQLSGESQDGLHGEILRRGVDDAMNLVSTLKQKYNDAKISESENVSDVTIIDHARSGSLKATSNRTTNTLLGGLMGLLLGSAFAFLKESLDTSIGAIEDVESFLGVSVLGVIPNMSGGKEEREKKRSFLGPKIPSRDSKLMAIRSRLVTHFAPRSPEAEAYQSMRTNVYSTIGEKDHLVILFTSSGPREGKSLTSANMAVASAQMGKKTLLVDCDLRRPVIHQIFGLNRSPGLFEVITGTIPYDKALKNITDILMGNMEWEQTLEKPHMAYLNLMTAGHLPANPPELLNSQEMDEILARFRNDFNLVILDCPPVLPVTDSLILGPKSDGVILVYQAGRTARGALKRSKLQLDTAKARVLGVVLNDVRPVEMEPRSAYYYRYRKYYSDELQKESETA